MCVQAAWQVIRRPMRTRREDVLSQIESSSHSLALVFCSIVHSFPLNFLPPRYAVSIIILVYIIMQLSFRLHGNNTPSHCNIGVFMSDLLSSLIASFSQQHITCLVKSRYCSHCLVTILCHTCTHLLLIDGLLSGFCEMPYLKKKTFAKKLVYISV